MSVWSRPLALLLLLVSAGTPAAFAQAGPEPAAARRVALVIGNGEYGVFPAVRSAKPDAGAVTVGLRAAGFVVTGAVDTRRDELFQAVEAFAATAAGAEMAVVYFSGQALDVGGAAYLMPTDALPAATEDVGLQALSVAAVLDAIEGASALRMVIIDADLNPFVSSDGVDRAAMAARQREPEPGSALLFSTRPDQPRDVPEYPAPGITAISILMELAAPEVAVDAFVAGVSRRVNEATGGAQSPELFGTTAPDIFLRGGPANP